MTYPNGVNPKECRVRTSNVNSPSRLSGKNFRSRAGACGRIVARRKSPRPVSL